MESQRYPRREKKNHIRNKITLLIPGWTGLAAKDLGLGGCSLFLDRGGLSSVGEVKGILASN